MKKYYDYAKHMNAGEHVLTWVETTLANYLSKNTPSTEEVEHIIDYLCQAIGRISKMSYPQARSNATKWTKTLQKKGKDIKETKNDTEVVLDFKDGFKVVKLIGENAYKREGFLMRHCCGSYYGKGLEVYSLRDGKNMPHCTMEKDKQIKGKGNGDIHPKYIKYVVEFLEHTGMDVRDSEMEHLGYVNVEKILKTDPDIKFPELFRGKYFFKENMHKLENKDNMALWGVFSIFEFNHRLEPRFNFDFKRCVEFLVSKLLKNASSGDYTKNASSGDYTQNASSGDRTQNASSGNGTQNASSGNDTKNASSGNGTQNASSGDGTKNASSGNGTKNASSGNYTKNASSGYGTQNEMLGEHSVSVDAGHNGRVKGKEGCWFCLSEWGQDKDGTWKPVCVKATKIDGEKIKADTWYKLEGGEFVEVEEEK